MTLYTTHVSFKRKKKTIQNSISSLFIIIDLSRLYHHIYMYTLTDKKQQHSLQQTGNRLFRYLQCR